MKTTKQILIAITSLIIIATSLHANNNKSFSETSNAALPTPVANFSIPLKICTGAVVTFTDLSTNSPTSWIWSFPGGSPSSSSGQNPTVSYASSGAYIVTLVSANGSGTSTAVSKTITVLVSPVVTASSNTTICAGTTLNFSSNGATSYTWSTGSNAASISVTPAITTNYFVTGSYTNNCTDTKIISVTVSPTPNLGVSSATICSGQSAALIANGATSYSWSTAETTASISVSPVTTTNYTVTASNTSGCTNTKTVSVTVNPLPAISVNNATICSGATANLSASGAINYSWNTGATTASISVTPTITTHYTVTGTGATGGCTDKKIATVIIDTPSLTVSSATICSGSTATIIANGAYSYSWSNSAFSETLIVSPTAFTIYTLTGTSATGCVKTTTVSVSIGTVPSIAANSQTICSGSSVTLSASGVNTYTWNTGVISQPISQSPTITTTYTVTGNLLGCTATGTHVVTVTVNQCVGINELINSSINISIYPNPAKDALYIESESLPENSIVEIYNSLGQKVSEQELNNSLSSVSLSDLSNGVYYLRIIKNNLLIHQTKIIKQD